MFYDPDDKSIVVWGSPWNVPVAESDVANLLEKEKLRKGSKLAPAQKVHHAKAQANLGNSKSSAGNVPSPTGAAGEAAHGRVLKLDEKGLPVEPDRYPIHEEILRRLPLADIQREVTNLGFDIGVKILFSDRTGDVRIRGIDPAFMDVQDTMRRLQAWEAKTLRQLKASNGDNMMSELTSPSASKPAPIALSLAEKPLVSASAKSPEAGSSGVKTPPRPERPPLHKTLYVDRQILQQLQASFPDEYRSFVYGTREGSISQFGADLTVTMDTQSWTLKLQAFSEEAVENAFEFYSMEYNRIKNILALHRKWTAWEQSVQKTINWKSRNLAGSRVWNFTPDMVYMVNTVIGGNNAIRKGLQVLLHAIIEATDTMFDLVALSLDVGKWTAPSQSATSHSASAFCPGTQSANTKKEWFTGTAALGKLFAPPDASLQNDSRSAVPSSFEKHPSYTESLASASKRTQVSGPQNVVGSDGGSPSDSGVPAKPAPANLHAGPVGAEPKSKATSSTTNTVEIAQSILRLCLELGNKFPILKQQDKTTDRRAESAAAWDTLLSSIPPTATIAGAPIRELRRQVEEAVGPYLGPPAALVREVKKLSASAQESVPNKS
ncbi:hypothetical protein HK104_004932 [Borealophlyctis nickersoniae]|nr:hypothetical protein HK104_004932 [Borealophlyctis nickersoniae]